MDGSRGGDYHTVVNHMTTDSLRPAAQQAADTIRAELELGANGFAADGWLGHLEAAERLLRAALAVPQEGEKPRCPKCGGVTLRRFCTGEYSRKPNGRHIGEDCQPPEHFHHNCKYPVEGGCGYQWTEVRGSVPPESAGEDAWRKRATEAETMLRHATLLLLEYTKRSESWSLLYNDSRVFLQGMERDYASMGLTYPQSGPVIRGMQRRSSPQPGAGERRTATATAPAKRRDLVIDDEACGDRGDKQQAGEVRASGPQAAGAPATDTGHTGAGVVTQGRRVPASATSENAAALSPAALPEQEGTPADSQRPPFGDIGAQLRSVGIAPGKGLTMAESDREDAKLSDAQRTTPGGVPEECPECGGVGSVERTENGTRYAEVCPRGCPIDLMAALKRSMVQPATPARSSLPPDFGKLIDGLADTVVETWTRTHHIREVRTALEAAIAALGQPSGDLERVVTWLKSRPGVSWKATVKDIEEAIRALSALAAPGEKV